MTIFCIVLAVAGLVLLFGPALRKLLVTQSEPASPYGGQSDHPRPSEEKKRQPLKLAERFQATAGGVVVNLPIAPGGHSWNEIQMILTLAKIELWTERGATWNQLVELSTGRLLLSHGTNLFSFEPVTLSDEDKMLVERERKSFVEGDDTEITVYGHTWDKRDAYGSNPDIDPGESDTSGIIVVDRELPEGVASKLPSSLQLGTRAPYYDLRCRAQEPADGMIFFVLYLSEEWWPYIGRPLTDEEIDRLEVS